MSKKNVQELQHPNWVFTIQHGGQQQPSLDDIKPCIDQLEKLASYLVVGKEVAPSTGQMHLQGYVELKKPARRTQLVKIIACFWEPAKGTGAQAADYCKKEADFYEVGELKEQDPGKREQNRWDEARQQAESGLRVQDSQIVISHYGNIRALQRDHLVLPQELQWTNGNAPNVWIYGEAGTGKSRKARADYPDAFPKSTNKWWCGYQNQPFVIIDDVDLGHACLGHHFKIWADRYPFPAEIKGSSIALRPQVICVTSQFSIDQIWSDVETRDALHRRFKSIRLGLPADAPALLKAAFNSPKEENKRAKILGLEEEEDETDENEQGNATEQESDGAFGKKPLSVGFPLVRSSRLGPQSSFTLLCNSSSLQEELKREDTQCPEHSTGEKKGFW